ncbi:MAG: DUF1667 domain-containing protein [Ignavibacteriales bacterium]
MEITCIICPNSCRVSVTRKEGQVTPSVEGAECQRGVDYAIEELESPVRVLTSTVRLGGGPARVIPVRTASPVPKPKIGDCMKAMEALEATAPVAVGDVITPNLAGTGVALIATWSVSKEV